MASRNFFIEGADPTVYPFEDGLPTSVVLQMIRNAKPAEDLGMVILSETTPDVVTHPEYTQFLWVKVTDRLVRFWNGSAWTLFTLGEAIDGGDLSNGSITIAKLSVSGGAALQLIRVKADLSGFEFVSLSSLLTAGSINVNALAGISGSSNYFTMSVAGTVAHVALTTAWGYLMGHSLNRLAPSKIANPSPTSETFALGFLSGDATPSFRNAVDFIRAGTVGTDKLSFGGSWADKWLKVNSSLTLVPVDPPTTVAPTAIIYYQEADGVDATFADGTSTLAAASTKQLRLNIESSDSEAIAVLASNEVELAAGTYEIEFWTYAVHETTDTGTHQGALILHDTTAPADIFAVTFESLLHVSEPHGIVRSTFASAVTLALSLKNSGTGAMELAKAATAGYVETYVYLKIVQIA